MTIFALASFTFHFPSRQGKTNNNSYVLFSRHLKGFKETKLDFSILIIYKDLLLCFASSFFQKNRSKCISYWPKYGVISSNMDDSAHIVKTAIIHSNCHYFEQEHFCTVSNLFRWQTVIIFCNPVKKFISNKKSFTQMYEFLQS